MHPGQEELKQMMEDAGLERVEYFNLTGGVVAVHRQHKSCSQPLTGGHDFVPAWIPNHAGRKSCPPHIFSLINAHTIYTTLTKDGFDLVYHDDSLLMVNKPAGLLAVPGRGAGKQDCLSARIQKEFPDALIVHRLDMATSGLLVFARGVEMQRNLSQMFRERAVQKRYVAVVAGKYEPASTQSTPSP